MTVLGILLPLLAFAAEPQLAPLPLAGLAREFAVEGVVTAAYRTAWGGQQRTLILSSTGVFSADANGSRSARLYATLFADAANGAERAWTINDLVDTCPVDVSAEFSTPPVSISDADADGEPEIWVSYRIACRGDVSPATLKLIGYEGAQKYALRGTTRLMLGDSSEGGEYEVDAALERAPKLLAYARKLWMVVRDERF